MSSGTTTVRIVADMTKFNAAMKQIGVALRSMGTKYIDPVGRARRRRQRRVFTAPKPLCIDGHEYARRRRARR